MLHIFAALATWLILFRLLKGKAPDIILDPFRPINGINFKIGARFDFTTVMHVYGLFLVCFSNIWIAIVLSLLIEIIDGLRSEQGFDLLDLCADALGIGLWFDGFVGISLF